MGLLEVFFADLAGCADGFDLGARGA